MKVWPAIVTVPLLGFTLAFAAIEHITLPGPLPLAPDVMLMNPALLIAVHGQPVGPLTMTVTEPPADEND